MRSAVGLVALALVAFATAEAQPVCGTKPVAGCVKKAPTAAEVVAKMKAAYAGLKSYSDSGSVLTEDKPIGSTMITEKHSFTTRFAAPKKFRFDFRKQGGERFVVWSPGETFNSWWSATGVAEAYAQGQGVNAFAMAELPTVGSALMIPALLFQAAQLEGPLVGLEGVKLAGSEQVGGRATYKLTATVKLNHWGGQSRPTTVWVDAETFMVRKVVEDTPTGMGGATSRMTTTIDPKPNAATTAADFTFKPPPQ